jgi:hypothetical protein
MDVSPLDEYAQRKAARHATVAARERAHLQLGNAKVTLFLAAIAYGAYALGNDPSAIIFGLGAAVFVALSVWHELVLRALARARAAVAYYEDGVARIEDRWMRDTPSGERFRDRNHPYADDLDVFGPRSLFQLLSSCRTPMGEARLASWLLRPSAPQEIRDRQARIAALRDRIDLRERIAVVHAGRRQTIHADRLIAWAQQPPSLPPARPLILALALAFIGALAWYLGGGPGLPVAVVSVINVAVLVWLGKRSEAIADELSAATASAALELLANVVREIEVEPFEAPAVLAMAARLKGHASTPAASRGIAALARIADWSDSRHTAFLKVSEIPILFTPQLAYAAESWRRNYGTHLRDWVDAVGEVEALLSIAGYSYEHPADPVAEIVEQDAPLFEATEVAHPLLPAQAAISNSLALAQAPVARPDVPQVMLVSGSNMSGKSTLMRTVGINAVLALAGAPVRARGLRLTPLQVGTCLRHTDSLQEHRSGFYTEALRIRAITDLLAGRLPVLFLFDELLSGTNSKDRRVAAEGVVRTMLSRGAIGMVTTHDLSLTEIAAIFPGQVTNVHLQDHVANGQMSFDYKIRDGVITHSNALELMRMIGLDV